MRKRHQLWAVAGLLVGRYGNKAAVRAAERAAEADRTGDGEARAIWSDVAEVIDGKDARDGADTRG